MKIAKKAQKKTAEKRLKELYGEGQDEWQIDSYIARDSHSRVHLSARDIDLITNLVVERLAVLLQK